jgi:hypothetical protein
MRLAGHVTCSGGVRNSHKILAIKPEGKSPLGKARHRYKDNIKMVL